MTDYVPGMADAIEGRRVELRLELGDLEERSGLTRQAIGNVRKGLKRKYNDKTRFGVANALQWPPDWYDRLLAGETPDESWHTPRPSAHIVQRDYNSDVSELSPEDQAIVDNLLDGLLRKQQG